MWASVSAQANVLSETWGPNLDLTIPSLETPSTWVLDSKDKHAITMGLTCCYRKELIDNVLKEHTPKSIGLTSRERARRSLSTLQLNDPISDAQWATFVGLQFLDIYSTYKGLQYDCVYELNPFLGAEPSIGKMFLTKTAILTPAIQWDYNQKQLTPEIMNDMNFLMTIVIINNFDVHSRAKKSCKKR